MAATSAGLLPFRYRAGAIEVLLVHPGGPFWARKDAGAWQIVKGLIEPGEDPAAAALREAAEELGQPIAGTLIPLGTIRQKAGKIVHAFAVEAEIDADAIRSVEFEMEWPPRSGRVARFPEVDRARWWRLEEAEPMMLTSQRPLLDRVREMLTSADR
ncbi:NUDIX domain-containing protein [Sphingomonas sp.]|uniref:NUDIX domain-containing protein n=1 Tax=Sphingomonas sp. TaxID=28214 RepID=UPI003B003055